MAGALELCLAPYTFSSVRSMVIVVNHLTSCIFIETSMRERKGRRSRPKDRGRAEGTEETVALLHSHTVAA